MVDESPRERRFKNSTVPAQGFTVESKQGLQKERLGDTRLLRTFFTQFCAPPFLDIHLSINTTHHTNINITEVVALAPPLLVSIIRRIVHDVQH